MYRKIVFSVVFVHLLVVSLFAYSGGFEGDFRRWFKASEHFRQHFFAESERFRRSFGGQPRQPGRRFSTGNLRVPREGQGLPEPVRRERHKRRPEIYEGPIEKASTWSAPLEPTGQEKEALGELERFAEEIRSEDLRPLVITINKEISDVGAELDDAAIQGNEKELRQLELEKEHLLLKLDLVLTEVEAREKPE